jgi:hypothetical protein
LEPKAGLTRELSLKCTFRFRSMCARDRPIKKGHSRRVPLFYFLLLKYVRKVAYESIS